MKIKNICCIGAGFVGGPTMAVIAIQCPEVKIHVVDHNKEKIKLWNHSNLDKLPVYEPGLKEIIAKTRNKNLFFSSDVEKFINESEMIFLAVNTPTKQSGEGKGMAADLTNIEKCAKTISEVANQDKIIIEKSTLPVRTAEKLKQILNSKNNDIKFEILSNPEFLAEGTAIKDLYKSDRVLIGSEDTESAKKAVKKLCEIYERWIPKEKILLTNIWSSELSKLASNAFLAQRISSINSLSAFCEKTGAKIQEVASAVGKDIRIGDKFLNASIGFGGSCFKKDILNLVYLSNYYGLNEVGEYWHQVVKINDYQKSRFVKKILESLKDRIVNSKIVLLGWSFKKNTNDSRESASIYLANELIKKGANIIVIDPLSNISKIKDDLFDFIGGEDFEDYSHNEIKDKIQYSANYFEASNNADAIVVSTEY
ncbi:MAG: nucleotide sugar dehydrogenase, partial [Gammaproteobacteria bacterium]